MADLKNLIEQGHVVLSPSKPGPGWVQVTQEILDIFEQIEADRPKHKAELERIKAMIREKKPHEAS